MARAARREIELVQSLGYKVTFMPQNLAHLGSWLPTMLERSGVEVITAPLLSHVVEQLSLKERAADF